MRGRTFKRMLAGFLAAVCLPLGSIPASAQEIGRADEAGVTVEKDGDTVTIGNQYISRQFSIAGGKLRTTQISNTRTGTGDEATVFTPGEGSEEFKIRVTKGEQDTGTTVSLPKIDRTGWTATADSWQNATGNSDGNAQNLLNDNLNAIWHTKYSDNDGNTGCRTEFPYNVIINMKKDVTFQSFSYTPRKEGETTNGNLLKYELYYYDGSSTEDIAADSADWKLLKAGRFNYSGYQTNVASPIFVNLDEACTAKQLKLVALSSNAGNNMAGGAEFNLHAEKAPEASQKNSREFWSSELTLKGEPVIEDTTATINDVEKTGQKVTFHFNPFTFRNVEYTISEVIVMYDGDHFMRKYMEISVPEAQRESAVIDYIDLESLVTNDTDATWTIPTNAGGIVQMEQFKANLGQPIYIQGMFFGCEFPAADNEIDGDDGTGYMRYYTGKSFDRLQKDNQLTTDGKYVTWQTVAGAARSTENAVIQADFFEYIKSIATPSEFRIQYNSWFDNMMRIDDDNILDSFIEIDRELNKAGVRPLDSYVVDDGWNNYNNTSIVDAVRSGNTLNTTGFWEFNSKFPQGLTPSSELVHKFGSNFGVWIGPRGGYNFYGHLADILTKSKKGSKAGGSIDVADRVYVQNFEDMAIQWMEEYAVNYWKWDGFVDGDQYGAFASADGVPGYENNHMTGGYHHMYHVTDLWEAWIDLMETVRQCEKEEGINKLWISLTCYVNPSPWYLQWANSVWIQCTADQADAGGSTSKMDRQMTYRDACYYDFLKNHEFQFPLSNLYNHDPVYGKENTGMDINTATDEQFQNYLYMLSTRGTAFWELYFSDSIMTDGKYEVTDEFLEWAEENYHMLQNAKMFGASPNTGTVLGGNSNGQQNAYGFACFDGTDGIMSFRNSATEPKSVTITFDRTLGVPEDAGTLKYHMEHSYNLTGNTPTVGEMTYGQEYTVTLQPDEVRILRFSKDGDTAAPEITKAYSTGEDQIIVKFNEKVKAEGFTVNGIAAGVQAGADDRTFHLTATEEALEDADILTVEAEGVTDLAGNRLVDNSRTFRYYADNAVVSAQHHTVRREEYLAKARDSLSGNNGFTVKAEIATGSTGPIVRQGTEYVLGVDDNGKAYFVLNETHRVTSDTKVNDGKTHRIVGVKENNGMLKIYVDGELEASLYDESNKDYDVQAADIVMGNTDFYGNVKAEVKDVAEGYDVIAEEDDIATPGSHNWTSGKVVTAKWTKDNTDVPVNGQRPLTMAVDGIKNTSDNYVDFGDDNRQGESSYLQVDFGGIRSVSSVNLYRYWNDGRTYGATVVALSKTADFSDPKIVYNSDTEGTIHGFGPGEDALYQETSSGKTFTLDEPYDARYIRVYMCSRSGSGTNHIVELEAIGGSQEGVADYTAVNQARALARFLLDNYETNPEWYSNAQADFDALEAARAAIVENKPAAEQAEVDEMAANIFVAASKIRKTDRKKLRNALEKAVLTDPEKYYTADSIEAYNEEVKAAQAVFDNENATAAQLTEALAQVNGAPDALVTLLSNAEKELAEVIKTAERIQNNPANTEENWKAFQDALKAGKDMQNRPLPARKTADFAAAKKAIEDAQALLVIDENVITGVTISAANDITEMTVGGTLQLTAVVATEGQVDDTSVTWSVVKEEGQDRDIVRVDENGLVTAQAAGTADVKATANGDATKWDVITLTVKARPITKITISADKTTVTAGEQVQLTAVTEPDDTGSEGIEWKILEESKALADVDENGVVTTKAAGVVRVKAVAKDGSGVESDTITLIVIGGTSESLGEAKKELGDAVSGAETKYPLLDKDKYTLESWTKLQEVLASAKAAQGNAASTEDDIRKAMLALEDAIKNLQPAAAVEDKIEQGKSYVVGDYIYTVTSLAAKTVEVTGLVETKVNTVKKISIGSTVSLKGTPYAVTSIGKEAFKSNKKATSVTIGANVTGIGDKAFYGCKALKSVKITSKKLTEIGKQAFAKSKKLRKITIKSAKLKKVGKNAFKGIYKKASIKVPSKKLTKYKKLLKRGQGSQVTIKK